jgi:hypothetical protein
MATITKDETVSVRVTPDLRRELDADARLRGLALGTVAANYLSEGVRRRRFPAIDFRDSHPGRIAYLVASRWPIWLIKELVEELGGNFEAAAKHMRKPVALVKMAMAYAEAYPQEISDCQSFADRSNFESVKQFIPGLEKL